MYLLKISLFIFAAFSHGYASTTIKPPQPLQHNTRKMNSLSNDHENCFCFPDGQLPTVQQLLDSQNNGQERLVIYLYKNSATNEIKMYTPNANKQKLIPDLPYEAGDGLITVTTENVYTLLYNNPYKIKVYNDNVQNYVPPVTESFVIGLHTGEIEHVYPNADNHFNPNNNYKGNEYSYAPNAKPINGQNGVVHYEPNKESAKYPNNGFPEQYNGNVNPEQHWMPNNYPYTKPDDPMAFPLNPQFPPNNPQAIPLNPSPADPQASPVNIQISPDNSQTILNDPFGLPDDPQSSVYKLQATSLDSQSALPNPQAFPGNPQVYPGTSIAIPDNNKAVPGNPQPGMPNPHSFPGNQQVYPGNSIAIPDNIPSGPGNRQSFPDLYIGGLDQHVVYSFPTNQGANKQQPSSQDINNPPSAQYMTFNVWFNEQMKRFQNIKMPNDIKTVDSDTLRILVQKTFNENNIYVSADGVLTDSKGIVIDAANLELRPLLLGETFSHQFLQSVRQVIKLPKHLPYLEGILVTLVSPPQILGIIPLGKTYLPETSYVAPPLGGLANANGSKIYISSMGTSTKVPYTLVYKEMYPGPTNNYAYSSANEVPTSGNLNSETYSKVVALTYPYSGENKKPQIGLADPTYWTSGPYQTDSQLPYPTANWKPSEILQYLGMRRKMSDAKIEHHYEAPKKSKQKKGDASKEITAVEPFPNINGTESGRRFSSPSLKGVMKTLLYILDDLPSRRGLNATEGVDTENESKSNVDENPDFRIIGGSAATGSGTPLSNKGRSGYTENA
ncbi:hypothetical protein PYW07_006353 [Mythimna separata]|uniref:Uncharacterized protein n=1 Tax=Mythimna separata TaxID=271217 RepID=A0AAD8DWG0_MYTSE|nr:hypothetical protein PYW07_006353 [Mythimna separata]